MNGALVLAPMRIEARALRRGGPSLRVERTGVGPDRTRAAAERLAGDPARSWIVAGLCGALDEALAPGDVVLPTLLRGQGGARVLPVREALAAALEDAGLVVRRVPLVSVEKVATGAGRRLLRGRGARAVDMESAWWAALAGTRRLEVVRVVVDGPGHEIMRPAFAGQLWKALRVLCQVGRAIETARETTTLNTADRAERAASAGEGS